MWAYQYISCLMIMPWDKTGQGKGEECVGRGGRVGWGAKAEGGGGVDVLLAYHWLSFLARLKAFSAAL